MTSSPQKPRMGAQYIDVIVSNIVKVNDLVTRFEFLRKDQRLLPPFSGGSHIVIEMQDGPITRKNPYSLMSDPGKLSTYAISVRRDDDGRGGSLFMHKHVSIGDHMRITLPINLFALDHRAEKHLFLAGGIGITPFISQIRQLEKTGGAFELHYAVRTKALGSYVDELGTYFPHQTHIYYDDQNQMIDLPALLAGQKLGTHVYVCGPKGMIDWVLRTASEMGWPSAHVHFEEFKAPGPGKPFSVQLAASGKTIHVDAHESLLEAIERAGIVAPFSCRAGACGQCETNVTACEGKLVHRDHWLEDDEKQSNTKIMPCVSRFDGDLLIIDR